MQERDSDTHLYKVVVNDEGQYSIWRLDRESPEGWQDEGRQGSRSECLAHIDGVWLDMRPHSLVRGKTNSGTLVSD